jgi:hypothetical protein
MRGKHEYIDIVVVGYKSGDDIHRLMGDLGTMGRRPFQLHYFDNSENSRTLTSLWNDLAWRGRGQHIAFLNTDIRISPAWDIRLIEALERDRTIGVAIPRPVGHDWTALACPGAKPMDPTVEAIPPPPEAMERIAAYLEPEKGTCGFAECNAAFYTVLMRRDLWESLKGFDERYRFYGQDHDFQRRLRARTGRLAASVYGSGVWHQCGGSVKKAMGYVDFNDEMRQQGFVTEAIQEGILKEWDLMDDAGRAAVREDPKYNRMPLFPEMPEESEERTVVTGEEDRRDDA